MRLGIGVALSFSILLVGVAGYFRTHVAKPLAAVVSVDNLTEPVLVDNTPSTTTPATNSEDSLTTTDLVSRQMMLDYLALANMQQDSQQNIDNLANKYANKVDSLYSPPPAGQIDLNIVADNRQNYKNYSATISNFVNEMGSADSANQGDDIALMKALASTYSKAVTELSTMAVPNGVSSLHRDLINKLAESAKALSVINDENADPMIAISDLSALYQNMSIEEGIIKNILDFAQNHE